MAAAARIGLISDTHGLLRPEAVAALAGSDLIIHAGDVGRPEILEQLAAVAPVVAVRGNLDQGVPYGLRRATEENEDAARNVGWTPSSADRPPGRPNGRMPDGGVRRGPGGPPHSDCVFKGAWASRLPETAVAEAGPARIYVLHDIQQLTIDPAAAGFQVVVSGHSHKPGRMERGGVLYLNPGSAGPRRFRLPITVARLDLRQSPWTVEFIELHPIRADSRA